MLNIRLKAGESLNHRRKPIYRPGRRIQGLVTSSPPGRRRALPTLMGLHNQAHPHHLTRETRSSEFRVGQHSYLYGRSSPSCHPYSYGDSNLDLRLAHRAGGVSSNRVMLHLAECHSLIFDKEKTKVEPISRQRKAGYAPGNDRHFSRSPYKHSRVFGKRMLEESFLFPLQPLCS